MISDTPFHFKFYRFDALTGRLVMAYGFAGGPDFEEVLHFPVPSRLPEGAQYAALDAAFRLLFLFAGVSYYKAHASTHMRCDAFSLDAATAAVVRELYLKGLGEFAYKNNLNLTARLQWGATEGAAPKAHALPEVRGALVPVGGGKDSVVTIEAVKQMGVPMKLFAVGSAAPLPGPMQKCIDVSGVEALRVTRTLSPQLLELNKQGVYNGHIPITAIVSMIAVCTALLHGLKAVVFSNERSASAPNTTHHGLDVNHQYSKSFAFESLLGDYITTHISPDLQYFSLLRPLSEVAIARRFAQATAYHSVFRSCNTAFRQDDKVRGTAWCCHCPKCRFVFLVLAPFLSKEKMGTIFGHNMLDDVTQSEGFAELCGISAFKPFECVGEIEESAAAMAYLGQMPEWKNDSVVARLAPQCQTSLPLWGKLLQPEGPHRIPADFAQVLA